jgi:hypothetical protein
LPPDFKLFCGGGSKSISGDHHHFLSDFAPPEGEFSDGSRLAGTVNSYQGHHIRLGGHPQLGGLGFRKLSQGFFQKQRSQRRALHWALTSTETHGFNKLFREYKSHVSTEQCLFQDSPFTRGRGRVMLAVKKILKSFSQNGACFRKPIFQDNSRRTTVVLRSDRLDIGMLRGGGGDVANIFLCTRASDPPRHTDGKRDNRWNQ